MKFVKHLQTLKFLPQKILRPHGATITTIENQNFLKEKLSIYTSKVLKPPKCPEMSAFCKILCDFQNDISFLITTLFKRSTWTFIVISFF